MGLRYLQFRAAQAASRRLPTNAALAVAERLAEWYGRCSPDREAVRDNLGLIRGAPVDAKAPGILEVFRNFGRYLVEFFLADDPARVAIGLDGERHLRDACASGRGVIVLTPHLGNWEAGAVILARAGYRMAAVALPHRDPGLDRLFNAQRRRCRVDVIPLGPAATAASLDRLRQGGLVGLLGDQVFSGAGVPVTLGRWRMVFPRGPAVLSRRAGAPVVPVFIVRDAPCRLRLILEPAIRPEPADGADPIAALTQRYATCMQRYIERFPEQWLIFRRIEPA